MTRKEQVLAHEQAAQEQIIDADFHLQIPNSAYFEYVRDDSIQKRLEEFGEPPKTYMGWKGSYASGIDDVGNAQGIAMNAEDIIEVRKEMAIDVTVVNPGLKFPNAARYPAVMNELTRAYNEYLLDRVVDVKNNVYGTVLVPAWDIEFAVKELGRVGDEPGIVGAHQWFSRGIPYGAIKFDPIYERLVDLNLPLTLHPSAAYSSRFTLIGDTQRSYVEILTASLGHVMMANVMNMIMTGLFEKFPSLDVVIEEAGTNWIPYLAHRGDELYQSYPEDVALTERMRELNRQYLSKLPSECIFENLYVTTQPIALPDRSDLVQAALKLCRAEKTFLYSTDWPHSTVDPPNWIFNTSKIDGNLRSHITHETAKKVFRFPN